MLHFTLSVIIHLIQLAVITTHEGTYDLFNYIMFGNSLQLFKNKNHAI